MMKKMWGGRFGTGSSRLLEEFNASINFDKELYREDIEGSIAHAKMLQKVGVISQKESKEIINGLNQILKECDLDKFKFDVKDEDIHKIGRAHV